MPIAAIYTRVSSELQSVDLSLGAQEQELRVRAERDGWTIYEVFSDAAETGRLFERPAFQRMMALSKQNPPPFTRIYLWDIRRFGRNRIESAVFKQRLRSRGIEIVYLKENIDDSATGKLIEGIMESVAEYESYNIAEDTRRGHREITRRGYYHGGIPPYGMRVKVVIDGGKERKALEPDPVIAERIRWIYTQRLAGLSPGDIARELNEQQVKSPRGKIWGIAGVEDVLTNPIYIGRLEYGRCQQTIIEGKRRKINRPKEEWTVCEEACVPIIEKDTWDAVQATLRGRREGGNHQASRQVYLLSGILTCANCGAAMIGTAKRTSGKNRTHLRYYYCRQHKEDRSCIGVTIRADLLEHAVMKLLKKKLSGVNMQKLTREIDEGKDDMRSRQNRHKKALSSELVKIEKAMANLRAALEAGVLARDVAPRITELGNRQESLAREIRELEQEQMLDQAASSLVVEAMLQDAAALIAQAEKAAPEELREVLQAMIRVEFDPKTKSGRVLFSPPLSCTRLTAATVFSLGDGGGGNTVRKPMWAWRFRAAA